MSQAAYMIEVSLPGHLGDPTRTLKTDPRADPRLVAALAPLGMDGAPPPASVRADSSLQAKLDYIAATEQAMGAAFSGLLADLPFAESLRRA
jgi:hypothetical protein